MNHRNQIVTYRRPAGPVVSYSCPLAGPAVVAGSTGPGNPRNGLSPHKAVGAGSSIKPSPR